MINQKAQNLEQLDLLQRDSGLDFLGNLPWGTHFCQFYQTQKDLLEILVQYFEAGLKNNEFCMWVTSEPLSLDQAKKAMEKAVPNFLKYLKKGQIEIIPYSEWYLKGDSFESKRVLNGWIEKLNKALKKGYSGLRLTGNTCWLKKSDWRAFRDYEEEINGVIGNYKMLALCTYSLDKCNSNEILDVVSNHDFALIKRSGKWETIESAHRKKAQQAEKEMLHLASFPRLNINPIIEIDMQSKVIYANPAAQTAFPDIEQKGKKHLMILGVKPRVVRKNEATIIREVKVKDRWYRQVIAYVAEVDSVRIYCTDITQVKVLEQQKDEFLGVATHELKTPVTSIKAYAQVLNKTFYDKNDKKAVELVVKLENQVNRLVGLITTLLDITKIQTGKMQFNYDNFDFKEMVADIIEEVRQTSNKHKFISKLAENSILYGDRERLGQVVTNLLTNAVKYSPDATKVEIQITADKKSLKLSVQDFGIGIPNDKQKKIFERFYQIKDIGDRTPTGLGLGLYISSEIIKRHQGRLEVKSQVGKGSTFYFTLPLKSPEQKT